MAKKPLKDRLIDRKGVDFNQSLLQSLEVEEVLELLKTWYADTENVTTLGYRFVQAVEKLYGQGVLLRSFEGDVSLEESAKHAIAVIAGTSGAQNGVVIVGARRSKKTFYVFTLAEMKQGDPKPRDPLSPGSPVEDGFTVEPYEVELYAEDGTPVVPLAVQAVVVLAWQTREFPNAILQASIAEKLSGMKNPEELKKWLPKAYAHFQQELRGHLSDKDAYYKSLLRVVQGGQGQQTSPFRKDTSIDWNTRF